MLEVFTCRSHMAALARTQQCDNISKVGATTLEVFTCRSHVAAMARTQQCDNISKVGATYWRCSHVAASWSPWPAHNNVTTSVR